MKPSCTECASFEIICWKNVHEEYRHGVNGITSVRVTRQLLCFIIVMWGKSLEVNCEDAIFVPSNSVVPISTVFQLIYVGSTTMNLIHVGLRLD